MIKLLLADDEPLVLIGLQSMIRWEDFDIRICGAAHNGQEALDMIEKLSPELVIADIRMPLKSGLEVMKICAERYGRPPLFILLTSYEELEYMKEAIRSQAVDYLIKLELTPESLSRSISKAVGILRELDKGKLTRSAPEERGGMQPFYDRFFVRLLNGLFENRSQYESQKKELGADFSFDAYAACYCEMQNIEDRDMNAEKLVKLYSSTIRMVRETVTKFMACYITSLDLRYFNITFCLTDQEVPQFHKALGEVLKKTVAIVHNYFNVRLICGVGTPVNDPYRLSESFYTARLALAAACREHPVAFSEPSAAPSAGDFDISAYKKEFTKAYEELDPDALFQLITRITDYFSIRPTLRLQAMDAACSLLYMTVSMLPDGRETVSRIFSEDPEGFRCIYKKRTTPEIVDWILHLRDGLCEELRNRKQSYRSRMIANVQKYIRENLGKKLNLQEVSALFGYSPNYLSQLFTRYAGCSFVEYTTREKIKAAKAMMAGGNEKIYEISEKLGFESAFYFSKVFKKVEGISPRDYINSRRSAKSRPGKGLPEKE